MDTLKVLKDALDSLEPFADDASGIHEGWSSERRRNSLTQDRVLTVGDFRAAGAARGNLRTLIASLEAQTQEPIAYAVAGEVTNWSRDFSKYRTQHYTRPVFAHPEQQPKFSQFLSDVVTAAGLLEHGKKDKGLASRIAAMAFELRTAAQPVMTY